MRQADLDLNKDRIQAVRSQLREFGETLQEVATEVSRPKLRACLKNHGAREIMRGDGVEGES